MPPRPNDSLVALVTGANRGLGFEVSRRLATLGIRVLVTARRVEAAEEAAARIAAEGGRAVARQLDVTDNHSVDRARNEAGRVDILINNAGILSDDDTTLLDTPFGLFEETIATNVIGALRVIRAFLPGMIERQYGRIVNVSSRAGQLISMGDDTPAYRISKTALNAVTRIAAGVATRHNVLVNSICPGWVRTDMGGTGATRDAAVAAAEIVELAMARDGSASGKFFAEGQVIPW